MVNIIEKQQQENKELLNEIELLKQQLADKDRELNDYKNTEVSEQEEAEFKQKATERIHQMLVEMRNRFPHCSKNIEQDLRELISKPLRNQFMNICFQHSLMHDYNWKEKENLEEVVERIVIDHFESTELATDLLKDWKKWNERTHIFSQIKEGGEIFGRPAKDIILKDIIGGKDERIKELEAKIEELEKKVEGLEDDLEMEREEAEKALNTAMKWREWQMKVKSIHVSREKWFLKRIEVLENNINWLRNKKQVLKEYENKELPALPKKQSRLLKLKQLVNRVKEKSKEKFQTYIVQKK